MSNPPPDDALVRQAQHPGSAAAAADAVAELYRRHAAAIFRYFWLRLGDQATAEDLAGDVFLRMVEALPRYENRGIPFSAWLFRIAHDRYVDYVRRSGLRRTEILSETLETGEEPLDVALSAHLDKEQLRAAIQNLSDEQQLVVQLRFIEGYNLEEVSHMMQKTVGAVKALQHRATRQLARLLEQPANTSLASINAEEQLG